MFFVIKMKKNLLMHPSTFGPKLHEEIKRQLHADVEGTVDSTYGFVILVTKLVDIPLGEVQEGGMVKFTVTYEAIVFRPFRNEVLDAVVVSVDSLGIRAQAGPLDIFIHKDQIPSDMMYDPNGPAYSMADETMRIQAGELLRLKITGLRLDAAEIALEQEQEVANNMMVYLRASVEGLLATIHHLRTENQALRKENLGLKYVNEALTDECRAVKNALLIQHGQLSQVSGGKPDVGQGNHHEATSPHDLNLPYGNMAYPYPDLMVSQNAQPSPPHTAQLQMGDDRIGPGQPPRHPTTSGVGSPVPGQGEVPSHHGVGTGGARTSTPHTQEKQSEEIKLEIGNK